MATMTSAQVKKALAPFRDFAPAILAAGEIIEAAEQAEKNKALADEQKAAREKELGELEGQIARKQQELQKVSKEVAALKPGPEGPQLPAPASAE